MNENTDFLKKIKILEECTLAEKKEVLPYFKKILLKKGETIFQKGDPGRIIYTVKSGVVGSYTILEDGERLELARFSEGMFFGELAMVEQLNRDTSCYALEDLELYSLDVIDFYQFVWNHPNIGIKILKALMRHMIMKLHDGDNFLTTMALWGEKARQRAITDELTGLYNKRFFEESLETAIANAKHKQGHLSLIMFDLDHFHSINREMDFDSGDIVLVEVAKIIKKICGEKAIIARLGGDEFVILLGETPFSEAIEVASRIKIIIKNSPITLEDQNTHIGRIITTSIGIAGFPEHGTTAQQLKEAVDGALYKAKESGRDRIKWLE